MTPPCPRFNKKQVISVQDNSCDDEGSSRSKELEFSLHQVFDNINQILKQIPDLIPKSCILDSSNIEDNNLSELPQTEIGKVLKKQIECNEQVLTEQESEKVANPGKRKVTDEDTGASMLKLKHDKQHKEIVQLRRQNEHLNHINDQLVKADTMLKEDLQEVNQNFAELIQVSEEAVKRRKLVQEEKDKLMKDKEELTANLHGMKKDIRSLQAKSSALYGLATLAEVTRRI